MIETVPFLLLCCFTFFPARSVSLPTFKEYGDQALDALLHNYYSDGEWKAYPDAKPKNHDWGDDSLTYALYIRWLLTKDPSIPPRLKALSASMNTPPQPCKTANGCSAWSDEYLWDSLAGAKEYDATQDPAALKKSISAFNYVDGTDVFTGGACPQVHYQRPDRGYGGLKTAESDTNYIRAALGIYEHTNDPQYLQKAKVMYESVRNVFLDKNGSNLYSVYVFDINGVCSQLGGRYYSSINGNMIYSGVKLSKFTGDDSYRAQSKLTALAVSSLLSDGSGIHVNLQAENDVVEPLIEGFYALWSESGETFAKTWILHNAAAAVSSIQSSTGCPGRFFNGPPPEGIVTEFQANGGFALLFAAAALDPDGIPNVNAWKNAVRHVTNITTAGLPSQISFIGTGIALIGTVGEICCEPGHARVLVDGKETTDTTGIWQNKASAGISTPNSVLFAWTWPFSSSHTIEIMPGIPNAKEGGSFVHIVEYIVNP